MPYGIAESLIVINQVRYVYFYKEKRCWGAFHTKVLKGNMY